jgi:hypothetical protein
MVSLYHPGCPMLLEGPHSLPRADHDGGENKADPRQTGGGAKR